MSEKLSPKITDETSLPSQPSQRVLSWAFRVLTLLVFGWAVWQRFGDLNADPALHLSDSAGVLFDPFSHSGNARSYLLFGDLHPDDWNTYIYSPIWVVLQVVWFAVFGISISSMHAYGAMWSILGVVLAWMTFRRFGLVAGLIAATFFGGHAIYGQLGRLALLENFAIFFLMVSFWALAAGPTPQRMIIAGASGFLAFVTKGTVFFVVPSIGVAVTLACLQRYSEEKSWRMPLRLFLCYLGGTLLVFLPWLFLFRIPNNAEISRVGAVWIESLRLGSFGDSISYFLSDELFDKIDRHDYLGALALATIGVTAYRLVTNWRRVEPLLLCMVGVFVGGALFVGLIGYKPTRFCQPIIPAMLGIATFALWKMLNLRSIGGKLKCWWAADIIGIVTLTSIFKLEAYLTDKPKRKFFSDKPRQIIEQLEPGLGSPEVDSVLASFLAALIVWVLLRVGRWCFFRQPRRVAPSIRFGAVSLVILHFAFFNVDATLRWWYDRKHSIYEANHRIMKGRSGHMVVGGLSVHALVMETPYRAVRIQHGGWHNSLGEGIFTDLGLTHLLLTDYNNLHAAYLQRWPKQMEKLRRVDHFLMCGQRYHLYEFPGN